MNIPPASSGRAVPPRRGLQLLLGFATTYCHTTAEKRTVAAGTNPANPASRVAPANIRFGSCSTPSSTGSRPAANGAMCPATLLLGGRFIITSERGSATGWGCAFTRTCANMCAWWRGFFQNPARRWHWAIRMRILVRYLAARVPSRGILVGFENGSKT